MKLSTSRVRKVLVFVPFKHAIDILTDKLRTEGITTEVIRGDVPAHKRTQIFKKFQDNTDPTSLGDTTTSGCAWCHVNTS